MKKALLLVLVVGVTVALTYLVTSHLMHDAFKDRMASERARWQAEQDAHAQIEPVSSPPAGRAVAQPADTSPPSPPFPPRPPAVPYPAAEPISPVVIPAAEGHVNLTLVEPPPLVVAPPPVLAPGQWIRYEATLPGNGTKVRIAGTSSIHDWQMEGVIITGFFEVDPKIDFTPGKSVLVGSNGTLLARAEAIIPVRSIKSYSPKMDEVYKEHMNEPVFRKIEYRLQTLGLRQTSRGAIVSHEFIATGELAIHGVTNKLQLPVKIQPLDSKRLKITGSAAFKMTDFGVQPPSPVLPMGKITTGNYITNSFEWVVQRR